MPHVPPDPDTPIEIPVSPGTTWTDQVGNTWTSFGSLVVSDDSLQNTRQNLVAFLKAHHVRWQWYDYPPDNLVTPAVVVNPGDPYIEPYTAGGPKNVIWGLDLVFVVKRAKPEQGLINLEFMFKEITQSLNEGPNAFPSARWLTFGEVSTTEIAGVEHLTAVLSIAVVSTFTN